MGYTLEELKFLVFFINQVKVSGKTIPQAGDEIKVLLPIGGG